MTMVEIELINSRIERMRQLGKEIYQVKLSRAHCTPNQLPAIDEWIKTLEGLLEMTRELKLT